MLFRSNLMIAANIIHAAYKHGVKKLLNLGSSCIYPKYAPQPLKESYLLSGVLEPTNEPYALAKIAAIKLCDAYNMQYGTNFISAMPTNLYGPNDNFNLETSHVMPALIRKFHEAKLAQTSSVTVWGTGAPLREFLYVDDMAAACVHVMELDQTTYEQSVEPMQSHINVGFGSDVTIKELASTIAKVTGYTGQIAFDASKAEIGRAHV